MSIKGGYSIKDLENLSGIKSHTLRIWEKRYRIVTPQRTNTNIRYYSNNDLRRLLNVSLLNKNGFKISAIAKMETDELAGHLIRMATEEYTMDTVQENLLLSMIELNEVKFNHAFLSALTKVGFEQTFATVVFPFFERIGVMWLSGTIQPAQEHFFSNMVRQKLIAATEALVVPAQPDAKTVVLLLPENELHEIGLLYYNYAFKARGYKCIYLGQSVPLESFDKIVQMCDPELVVTGMTNSMNNMSIDDYAAIMDKLLSGKKIFFTGPLAEGITGRHEHMLGVKELRELLDTGRC